MKKTQYDTFENRERVSLTLSEDLNNWLYNFSVAVKKAGGYRIPKTLIIRAFIRAVKESQIGIDLSNIRDDESKSVVGKVSSKKVEDKLVKRLKEAFRKQGDKIKV